MYRIKCQVFGVYARSDFDARNRNRHRSDKARDRHRRRGPHSKHQKAKPPNPAGPKISLPDFPG